MSDETKAALWIVLERFEKRIERQVAFHGSDAPERKTLRSTVTYLRAILNTLELPKSA